MTSIVQFADIHFGVEDKEAMTALAAVVSDLKPDVTVICGDITQNGKTHEFYAARDWIRTLPGPKIITAGNHDTPMFGILQRIFDPFGRFNEIIGPLSEPYYADQFVAILPINTSRGWQFKLDWSLGVVDLDELERLAIDMQSIGSSPLKFIMAHHPFIYPAVSPLQKVTENGARALKRLSRLNIDAVLSGHVHVPFTLERQLDDTEIMSIGAGTLSIRRRNKPAGFNHIYVDSDIIRVTPIAWEDGRFNFLTPFTKKITAQSARRL